MSAGTQGANNNNNNKRAKSTAVMVPKKQKIEPNPIQATNNAFNTADQGKASLGEYTQGPYIDIGTNRLVYLQTFQGNQYVAFRDYFKNQATGMFLPTRRGISLTKEQWEMLKENSAEIDEWIYGED